MIHTIVKTQLYVSYATPEGKAYAEEKKSSFRGKVREVDGGVWFESFEMKEMKT